MMRWQVSCWSKVSIGGVRMKQRWWTRWRRRKRREADIRLRLSLGNLTECLAGRGRWLPNGESVVADRVPVSRPIPVWCGSNLVGLWTKSPCPGAHHDQFPSYRLHAHTHYFDRAIASDLHSWRQHRCWTSEIPDFVCLCDRLRNQLFEWYDFEFHPTIDCFWLVLRDVSSLRSFGSDQLAPLFLGALLKTLPFLLLLLHFGSGIQNVVQ